MGESSRRELIVGSIAAGVAASQASGQTQAGGITKFVRFQKGSAISMGILEGDRIDAIQGDLFGTKENRLEVQDRRCKAAGSVYALQGARGRAELQESRRHQDPTCQSRDLLQTDYMPAESGRSHCDSERLSEYSLRRRTRRRDRQKSSHISVAEAKDVIFGVCCGNDVSERDWQGGPNKDLQWWRAKGADTSVRSARLSCGDRLRECSVADKAERYRRSETEHVRPAVRLPDDCQLYQPVRDAGFRRCHLHRHSWQHEENEPRRCGGSRHRGRGLLRNPIAAASA